MKMGPILTEAVRDARSHIDKGTGLSDEAIERICLMLLFVVEKHPVCIAQTGTIATGGK